MSTDYHVYCVTCDEPDPMQECNRSAPSMKHMVRNAIVIGEMLDVMEDGDCDLVLSDSYERVNVAWYKAHSGHELRVRDEYGRLDGQCRDRITCGHCLTPKNCVLIAGHEGQCSPVRASGP